MKLFNLVISIAFADKGGKDGKHGRVDISGQSKGDDRSGINTKWIWQYPLCVTAPDNPSCDESCIKDFTSESGEIVVDLDNFRDYQSCLWTIKVNPNKHLVFEFDKATGFDVEYHQYCGYDRLHIFSGTVDEPLTNHRHARFCGPKDGSTKPYDGAGKIKETDGILPFWDEPYDVRSNQAFIGFDIDQTKMGSGFILRWNAIDASQYDFTDVYQSHEFLASYLQAHIRDAYFARDNAKSAAQKRLSNMMARSRAALEKNPAATVRRRRCAVPHTQSVSDSVQIQLAVIEAKSENEFAFTDAMDTLKQLLNEYIGRCRIGSVHWPRKVQVMMEWIERKACTPMDVDCRQT